MKESVECWYTSTLPSSPAAGRGVSSNWTSFRIVVNAGTAGISGSYERAAADPHWHDRLPPLVIAALGEAEADHLRDTARREGAVDEGVVGELVLDLGGELERPLR